VALAWCFEDEATPATDGVLLRVQREGGIIPPLWVYEISNALVTAMRKGRLAEAELHRLRALLDSLPLDVCAGRPNSEELVATAYQHGLLAYDAAYLALARAQGLPLATLDADLAAAAVKIGVAVLP